MYSGHISVPFSLSTSEVLYFSFIFKWKIKIMEYDSNSDEKLHCHLTLGKLLIVKLG